MKFTGRLFFLASLTAAFAMLLGGNAYAELIAHYEFNEAAGTTDNLTDSSGNSHTLTQEETAGGGTVAFDADLGSNVLYNPDGSGYLMGLGATGSLDLPANSSITLAGWFKQTGIDADSPYIYAMHLGYNGSEPICTLGFLGDGTIASYCETDNGDAVGNTNLDQVNVFSSSPVLNVDENGAFDGWHHVAIVYDRSIDIATIYLDGIAIPTTVNDVKNPAATHTDGDISHLSDTHGFSFESGADAAGRQGNVASYAGTDTRQWIGYLDDVRFYSNALSAGEVAQLAGVPEPSTFALLVCGAMGLLALRRK